MLPFLEGFGLLRTPDPDIYIRRTRRKSFFETRQYIYALTCIFVSTYGHACSS